MKNNIKALRTRAGMSQKQLADATGVGIPQVSKWETGRVDIPTSRIQEIAKVLRTTPDQLLSDSVVFPYQSTVVGGYSLPQSEKQRRERALISERERAADHSDEATPEQNAVVVPLEGSSEERMRQNLPIYGTALGAPRQVDGEAVEQVTLNKAEVLEYVKRPVLLNGNALAYGLRVQGHSMEPRHRDGEMLIVDPTGRVGIGEDVVVYLRPTDPNDDDGDTARAALVKRIVRRSSGYIELEQYQPAKTFRIDTADILRVDRVVPWQELLG
jgi:transcriptional regulator with XRE-family HTH domain